MNALAQLYPGDDAVRLAASVAVQTVGVVLIALAASWALARRNAALRDGIWKAALTLVCVAPLAAWGFQRSEIAFWHTPSRTSEPARESPENSGASQSPSAELAMIRLHAAQPLARTQRVSDDAPRTPLPESSRIPTRAEPRLFEAVVSAIALIWVGGTVLLLARLLVGLRVVARLRRDLAPFSELHVGIAERLRRTLGVTTLPSITLSRRIGGPASLGPSLPIVVLPTDLAAKMNAEELHDALAHECAHALRRDARVALLQQVVAAVYWFHPLIHLLNRQLARAREEVCDNVVLAGTSPTDYARTLLTLSQIVQSARCGIAVVPMFDPRWRLARRVAGLLNRRRIVMVRMNRATTALIVAIALILGTALAAVTTAGERPNEARTKPSSGTRSHESAAAKSSSASDANEGTGAKPRMGAFASLSRHLKGNKTNLEDLRFDVRKAELDVKEAEVLLDVKKHEYRLDCEANDKDPGAVPVEKISLAEANMHAGAVQVEQARLSWERARAKLERAMPALVIYAPPDPDVIGWPLDWVNEGGMSCGNEFADFGPPFDASGGKVSLKSFFAELSLRFKNDPRHTIEPAQLRVALVRFKGSDRETVASADDLTAGDYILGGDLLDGKAKDEVVHPGDVIVLFDPRSRAEEPAATRHESAPATKQ